MKVHWYFKQWVLDKPKRSRVTVKFCERVVAAPEYSEVQNNGRVCYWGHVPEIGYHIRVIVLEDGETLFNAFEDRNFTRRQRRRT